LKFAVFTDLHYDVIHDGDRRIRELIHSVKKENVDFIVELGDLCHPTDENKHIILQLKELGIPCFFNVGNHDSDAYPKDVVLKFLGMKHGYYSFVFGNVKFIVMDANYINTPNGSEPFYKRNYYKTTDAYPYVPEEEIEWLRNEMDEEQFDYVIFSHQSLSNDFMKRGITNREEVRAILEQRNCKGKKVLFCMNGHDHGDDVKVRNGIHYYTLNSMSYIWHGIKETFNYSKEIHDQYPYLKDIILYEEPLYAIVTIDENSNVQINGVNGHYQNVTPKDIGLENKWNGVSIEPKTSSLYIGA
jgi:predicted MPP superfamily phosphohydrolase